MPWGKINGNDVNVLIGCKKVCQALEKLLEKGLTTKSVNFPFIKLTFTRIAIKLKCSEK